MIATRIGPLNPKEGIHDQPTSAIAARAIAMIAGALASSTDNLNVNVGITIILVSGVLFLVEYVRSQR